MLNSHRTPGRRPAQPTLTDAARLARRAVAARWGTGPVVPRLRASDAPRPTESSTVWVICPDWDKPSGGVRVQYRVVDALNAAGLPAAIVHRRPGFACTWFAHSTRIVPAAEVLVGPGDVIAVPEIYGSSILELPAGVRQVVFNQNPYVTLDSLTEDETAARPYLENADLAMVLTVSEHSADVLRYALPGVPVRRLHLGLDPGLHHPPAEPAPRRIAYMPRRRATEAAQVLRLLELRGRLDGWEIVPIDGCSQREAADRLRGSRIFLSFSEREGFGLPPCEALACGCLVVGFDGFAGREFFGHPFAESVEDGDVVGFARAAERLMRRVEEAPVEMAEIGRTGARFVAEHYSPQTEREDLLEVFGPLLAPAPRRARARDKRVVHRVPSSPRRRPAVTAVIPTFNYGRFLGECARSVLSQRDVETRVIIVDDGSTDETPRVTAELEADPRVTVLRHVPNRGQLPSVNRGAELVDTEYVVKLDADDLIAPGAFARATALLEAQPGVGFVYGRPLHFSGPAPQEPDRPARSWTVWPGDAWISRLCRMGFNAISQPEVVMRTAVLRQALPIAEELPHTFDVHLWLQLAALGDVGRINGPAQGHYRVHDASLQHTVNAGVFFDLRERRAAFDLFFAGLGSNLPDAALLRDHAHRALAGNGLDRACRAYDRGRTGEVPIDEFVAFALETWPAARTLPEWAALERRRAVGAARAASDPRFVSAAAVRRSLEEVSRLRWRHTGEVGPQRWQQLAAR